MVDNCSHIGITCGSSGGSIGNSGSGALSGVDLSSTIVVKSPLIIAATGKLKDREMSDRERRVQYYSRVLVNQGVTSSATEEKKEVGAQR